jgi:hypothetical protein
LLFMSISGDSQFGGPSDQKRGPRSSSFWLPRNLSHHMDRQALTGDTVLVESGDKTGRSQTLPWWLGEGGVKTTDTDTDTKKQSIKL